MSESLENIKAKSIECHHSRYILTKEGILEIYLKDDFCYTIKEASEITTNIKSITNNIPHKTLIISGVLSISDESAREYSSTKESTDPIKAMAIVTRSLPQTIIANFIMKFQKPSISMKVFNSVEEAKQWLRSLDKSL